ncbi:TRAP transporter small permease subunit [Frigidibacter sp. ROC022]|uniref:TRAP transporter small permease subunit n=1 Tax=Frigidibacter sp. ROC022 TaxID=2971796 RepID=UPI00215A32E3|nr:TRAP transporter small permease [Frigidibacter sp. ROC022]MCR8725888.1 TRAP transporter small permease [Frigidibacter sp. ROC022]
MSRLAIRTGGSLIVLIALLITAEILLRRFANISTGGTDELSGYALAISSTWALSYTLHAKAHVRVDALYTRLPSGPRAWLDCLGIVSIATFSVILTWFCWRVLQDSLNLSAISTSTLAIPLWLPQGLWLIGMIQFSLSSVLLAVACLHALLKGDRDRVSELAGSRTMDDELPPNQPAESSR